MAAGRARRCVSTLVWNYNYKLLIRGWVGMERLWGTVSRRDGRQRSPRTRAESRPVSWGVWRGLGRSAQAGGLGVGGGRGASARALRGPASSPLRAICPGRGRELLEPRGCLTAPDLPSAPRFGLGPPRESAEPGSPAAGQPSRRRPGSSAPEPCSPNPRPALF